MARPATWDPLTDWKPAQIAWVKVDISPADLRRFTERSNVKGLSQSLAFLLLLAGTGSLAYFAFSRSYWVLLFFALYFHGSFYSRFGDALHELSHNTVFRSHFLNVGMTALYGWLFWPWNPHFYRLSHQGYHHRYTLHQGSDGEDTPNYVCLNARLIRDLFFRVIQLRELAINLARLFTLTPTSKGWRGRGFRLDTWEQFVLKNASEKDRQRVYRFGWICLIGHVGFVAVCLSLGAWLSPAGDMRSAAQNGVPGTTRLRHARQMLGAMTAFGHDLKLAEGQREAGIGHNRRRQKRALI